MVMGGFEKLHWFIMIVQLPREGVDELISIVDVLVIAPF